MGTDDRRVPVSDDAAPTSRRRLLGLAGGGVAAAVALAAKPAQAGHEPGDIALHLGESNGSPPGSETFVFADVDGVGLVVQNGNAGDAADGFRGSTFSANGGAAGVRGHATVGIGIDGWSGSGVGVLGHTASGTGGSFESATGQALLVNGQTNMGSDSEVPTLNVYNASTADPGMAIYASTAGLKTVISENSFAEGESFGVGIEGVHSSVEGYGRGLGVGVSGVSAGAGVRGASQGEEPGGFGIGPGVGVQGLTGPGIGVHGVSNAPGEEGFGAGDGVGVEGRSGAGVALRGVALSGRALEANGRAAFSTAGTGTVTKGQRTAEVLTEAVTELSHVSVTLTSDPRGVLVEWVERQVGTGFTVRLNAAAKRDTDFSYLVVEPVS